MQGGQAIAEILFGRISPAGRLPVSIPNHVGQLPVYYNYKSTYTAMNYYDSEKKPLYPFGYGMTYSELSYENIRISHTRIALEELENTDITISIRIKNKGAFDTYAVPQLYLRDIEASTVRRVRELKAFTKVAVPAGEVRTAILSFGQKELSLWNAGMEFCVEKGDFKLMLCDLGREYWSKRITIV
jgi:beta-glucosidase